MVNVKEELEQLYKEASAPETLTEDQQTQIMTRLRILQFYDAVIRQSKLEDIQKLALADISGTPSPPQADYN